MSKSVFTVYCPVSKRSQVLPKKGTEIVYWHILNLFHTWLSKSPASLTSKTSKTQDLRRVTWSSWCKHLKPGMSLAKVQTWRTWSMNLSLNCSINESSGRPFIGQVWKNTKISLKCQSISIDPIFLLISWIYDKFIRTRGSAILNWLSCVFCREKRPWDQKRRKAAKDLELDDVEEVLSK